MTSSMGESQNIQDVPDICIFFLIFLQHRQVGNYGLDVYELQLS